MNNIELLPQRLKEKRKELGFTLAQVAERIDLSVSFLSDIEVGRANPSLDTLVKLAACYEVSLLDLWVGIEAEQYERQMRIRVLEKMLREIRDELSTLCLSSDFRAFYEELLETYEQRCPICLRTSTIYTHGVMHAHACLACWQAWWMIHYTNQVARP